MGTPKGRVDRMLEKGVSLLVFGIFLSVLIGFAGCNGSTSSSATKVTVTAPTLSAAYPGTAYSSSAFTASGGTGSGYTWTMAAASGSSVPSTYSIGSSTGIISATAPVNSGSSALSYSVVVTATDSSGNAGSATVTLSIEAAISISTSTTLTAGTVGSTYSQSLAATGGSGSYTWSTNSAGTTALSALGLSLTSAGAVTSSGTKLTASDKGTASFTATVTDTASHTASATFSVTVSISSTAAISTTSLNALDAGQTASQTLAATGGSGSYSWSWAAASGSSIPSGLSLSTTGVISGSATSAGTHSITVTLADTSYGTTTTQTFSLTVYSALTLPTTTALTGATWSTAYSNTLVANGGSGSTVFYVNSSAVSTSGTQSMLASGYGLYVTNGGSGTLSIGGTPSGSNDKTVSFTVYAVDSTTGYTTGTTAYSIEILPSATLTVTVSSVPQGMANMPYTLTSSLLSVSGGTSPYTVTFTTLPSWATASSTAGVFTGTPTSSGSYTALVKVLDSSSTEKYGTLTITIPVVAETTAGLNGELNGQYACVVEDNLDSGVKYTSGAYFYRGGMAFAFSADGSGNISSGELDVNSPESGYNHYSSLTGSYAVGSDNRGYLTLTSSAGTSNYAIAGANLNSSGYYSSLALVNVDDVGSSPSGQTGTGHCYRQSTSTNLNTLSLTGTGMVFGLRGEDGSGLSESYAGYLSFSGGNVSGEMDMADEGTYNYSTLTGTYSTSSAVDSFGRTTITAGLSSADELSFVIYLTNDGDGRGLIMDTEPHDASSSNSFLSGETRTQTSPTTLTSGKAVIYLTGVDNSTTLSEYKSQFMQLGSSSTTSANIHVKVANDNGTVSISNPNSSLSFTLASSTTGRATTATTATSGDIFYFYNTNKAVVLYADGSSPAQGLLGWMMPQSASGSSWNVSQLETSYSMRKVTDGDYGANFFSGELTVAGTSTSGEATLSSFAQDKNATNYVTWDEGLEINGTSVTGTLIPDSTYDASNNYGLFDLQITEGTTSETLAYCLAAGVDVATSSSSDGKMLCISTSSSDGGYLMLLQE